MDRRFALLPILLACGFARAAPGNDLIDYDAFARNVQEVRGLRESRRVSEEEFARMARMPGTVVLDARSERLYRLRHIEGAVNLHCGHARGADPHPRHARAHLLQQQLPRRAGIVSG